MVGHCERCSIPQLTRAAWCWCRRHGRREPWLCLGRPGDAGHGQHSPSHPSAQEVPGCCSPGLLARSACLWDAGTELWHGGRRRVWRRLCCFAMFIGRVMGGINESNNPAAPFACLSLFCCPPRTPDGVPVALGVPRVSATARLAWDWSTVL